MSIEISDRVLLWILEQQRIPCKKCNQIGPLHITEYQVTEFKNAVVVKLACHAKHHHIGTRALKLNEVLFAQKSRPWEPPGGKP